MSKLITSTRSFHILSISFSPVSSVSRRHFAAACFTLRAQRDTDGARVVVSAALSAVMAGAATNRFLSLDSRLDSS